jgi:hypothetical protein
MDLSIHIGYVAGSLNIKLANHNLPGIYLPFLLPRFNLTRNIYINLGMISGTT